MTTSLPQAKSWQSTASTPATTHPEPFWRSLFYFNVYRLLMASGIVATTWLSPESSFGSYNPRLFLYTALAYIVFGGISLLLTRMQRLHFDWQLAIENILECTLALCPDAEIGRDGLRLASVEVLQDTAALLPPAVSGDGLPLQDYLDRLEKESIIEALKKTRYNRTTAARLLGITVRSMRYRMERLGLNDGDG